MDLVFRSFQSLFVGLPLPALEAWGLAGYLVGCALLVAAYGNLTFRPGGRWGLGWRRQTWDDHALKAALTTFVLIMVTGYLGSFVVLVPGAQTFESLKDLSVFVCLLVFGYPALVVVPLAYGLSDLIEGVPPDFLLAWLSGYWINPSCFWMAVLLLGKAPDFRRAATWARYFVFVAVFLAVEPALWGFVCNGKFPEGISYYQITPALFFTTVITWLLAPIALVTLLPLAKKTGWLWTEIPGHVKEWDLFRGSWVWKSGAATETDEIRGIPIRLALAVPFLLLLLATVGSTAYVSLNKSETAAASLAGRLHEEMAANIVLQLDEEWSRAPGFPSRQPLDAMLAKSSAAQGGRAYLFDLSGRVVATSFDRTDPVLGALPQNTGGSFSFDVVTAQPMSHETWMARSILYHKGSLAWTVVTALPASAYLGGVQAGGSQSALVFTWALILALGLVVIIAGVVTGPLERMAKAAKDLAAGNWTTRVPSSRIGELEVLTASFNTMAEQTQNAVERIRASEAEFRNIFEGALEGFYRTSTQGKILMANPALARILGYDSAEALIEGIQDTGQQIWARREDRVRVVEILQREGEITGLEVRFVRADTRMIWISLTGRYVSRPGSDPYFEGFVLDIDERKKAELELGEHRSNLEKLVASRTRELESARDAADAANHAKSLFLANMSHEIRTPMNAVLGFAQLLGQDETLPEQAQVKIKSILNNGEHLMALIGEILEISRIDTGRADVNDEVVSLRAVVEEVTGLFQVRIRENLLDLKIEAKELPDSILTDRGKLRQILVNLLSTAVKISTKGVVLRGRQSGTNVVFEVHEAGPVDAGSEASLSLTISRKLAQLMGGSVEIETGEAGSLFRLKIPFRQPPLPAVSSPPPVGDVPAEWRQEMQGAVVKGSLSKVRELSEQIASKHPALAEWLLKEVARYDLEGIRALFPLGT